MLDLPVQFEYLKNLVFLQVTRHVLLGICSRGLSARVVWLIPTILSDTMSASTTPVFALSSDAVGAQCQRTLSVPLSGTVFRWSHCRSNEALIRWEVRI
jgi:hypothetical protein